MEICSLLEVEIVVFIQTLVFCTIYPSVLYDPYSCIIFLCNSNLSIILLATYLIIHLVVYICFYSLFLYINEMARIEEFIDQYVQIVLNTITSSNTLPEH